MPTDQQRNFLLEALYRAFGTVYTDERELFDWDVAERTICGRIAVHLEFLKQEYWFKKYYCDVEFNRAQDGWVKAIADGKTIAAPNVLLDVAIHGRDKCGDLENLLCVEVKKEGAPLDRMESDRERLCCLTLSPENVWLMEAETPSNVVCGYLVGVFIIYDAMNDNVVFEIYKDGKLAGTCQENRASFEAFLKRFKRQGR